MPGRYAAPPTLKDGKRGCVRSSLEGRWIAGQHVGVVSALVSPASALTSPAAVLRAPERLQGLQVHLQGLEFALTVLVSPLATPTC